MTKKPDSQFSDTKKVKFINPPNHLKSKIGSGGLNPDVIAMGEDIIDKMDFDVLPYAKKYCEMLEEALKKIVAQPGEFSNLKEEIIEPIMQIKGSCGMFKYRLLSDVAAIALHFLEVTEEWNDDAHQVVIAHTNTIRSIIKNDMKGSGGKAGDALVRELHNACERYFAKHTVEE